MAVQIGGVRINNLHFADDTALLAESPNELQAMVKRVVEVSENNIETEIQHMGRAHKDFNIAMKNLNLKQTVNFAIWEETTVQRRELFQMSRGG